MIATYITRIRRALAYVGRRLRNRAAQGMLEYFLILGAVGLLGGLALFTFGGNLGNQIVQGQRCSTNIAQMDSSTTSTGAFTAPSSGPC